MKAYYAHCLALYDSPQEKRDLDMITSLGLEIVNPNNDTVSQDFKMRLAKGQEYMDAFADVFYTMIDECEVFVFRALPDGRIPGGVAKELQHAESVNKIIIELPSNSIARSMGRDDTRQYLKEIGYR